MRKTFALFFLLALLLALALVGCDGKKPATSQKQTNTSSIDITAEFTDENFKAVVYEVIGKQHGSAIFVSDVSDILVLKVGGSNIASLAGVEYFAALEVLVCASVGLTSLDVSQNTALKEINCTNNRLTSLVISKNTALEVISCGMNHLTSLDVSKNIALVRLSCYKNQLTSLDVSNNKALRFLSCEDNYLTEEPTGVENLDLEKYDFYPQNR